MTHAVFYWVTQLLLICDQRVEDVIVAAQKPVTSLVPRPRENEATRLLDSSVYHMISPMNIVFYVPSLHYSCCLRAAAAG